MAVTQSIWTSFAVIVSRCNVRVCVLDCGQYSRSISVVSENQI